MKIVMKPLDELGYLIRGKSKHRPRDAAHLYDGPYPFIQTSDVKNAGLYITEYTQTYSAAGLAQSKLWKSGTLCITIAANIGDTAILAFDACFPDSIIGFIPDPTKSDARYIKYLFDTVLQQRFKKFTQGAAQDNLSQEKLLSLKLPVAEDVNVQRVIADKIAIYDDLIDANRRRIQLLEESARLLFREWFVYFRFPGHEKVKIMKDGISKTPEGWVKEKVVNVVKRVAPGELYDQATAEPTGIVPILDQGKNGIIGYHNNEPSVIASLDNPVIVFANHTCNQRIIHFPFSAIQNIFPFLPSDENYRNIYWLHYATDNLVQLNAYKGHWPEYMAKNILLPPEGLCDEFGNIIGMIHKQIFYLSIQNQKLAQARDLLLPRLMSGAIVV